MLQRPAHVAGVSESSGAPRAEGTAPGGSQIGPITAQQVYSHYLPDNVNAKTKLLGCQCLKIQLPSSETTLPLSLCFSDTKRKRTSARILRKNVQISPLAGFVWFVYQCLCNKYFFGFEFELTWVQQPFWFAFVSVKSNNNNNKSWLLTLLTSCFLFKVFESRKLY